MDYLFLRRHRRTATSKRQKNLLLKAAERQWELQFANKGAEGRKVDCTLYKCILYNLEIKQVFLDSELSLKKFSVMIDTNQTYLSNVVNKYFNCNLKELLNTTTINLAAALRQKKKRVLAIDMDGQANLTESCGLSIEEEQTVYGAMRGEYPLPVIELENGLAVVPSCLDLSAAESELINEPGRELILKGLIAKLLDSRKFDYILIDCPPSLGLLTLNALTTADFLIIPVQAQFLAMRGMAKITSVIEIVKERLNPNLSIGGIVITQFDKRKTLNKSVAEIINDSFCDKVFKTIVRDNVALAEAPIKGKNVFEYNKNCNGAKDYMALAQEVLKLK